MNADEVLLRALDDIGGGPAEIGTFDHEVTSRSSRHYALNKLIDKGLIKRLPKKRANRGYYMLTEQGRKSAGAIVERIDKCMHCGSLKLFMMNSCISADGIRKRRYLCRACDKRQTVYVAGATTVFVENGSNKAARALALVKAGLL